MKALFLILMIWSAPTFASPLKDARNDVQKFLLESAQITNVVQRMDYFSGKWLGLPYGLNGPLGEGESGRYDQDPLFRFDTFDCTTFVETVISLARSSSLEQFEDTMNRIRYRNGVVDYLERNHFPEKQWIPNNVANGYLVEINHLILPASKIKNTAAIHDFGNWLRFKKPNDIQVSGANDQQKLGLLADLQGHASLYSPVPVSIDYLPVSELLSEPESLSRIPSGTLVNFVRVDWKIADRIGTDLLVSHQGLVFQKNGVTVLRHASFGAEMRVVEVVLSDYLRSIKPESSLKGIHLLQPTPAL